MINAIVAAGLMATGAYGMGKAIVVNQCSYDVSLSNVPASGGGYSTIDQTLSSGATYSQTWTSLSNTMGWSIKLFKGQDMSNILQYEYTCHDDGITWFDLSEVNGNPWDGNWEITATGNCSPRQAAYRFATDDAYGMQDCPEDSDITVTLCSGESGGAAPSGGAPAPSSPAETSAPTHSHHHHKHGHHTKHTPPPPSYSWAAENNKVVEPVSEAAPVAAEPSTLATSSTQPYRDPNAVYVTNWATEYVTHTVTAEKRSPTHARRHNQQ